MKTAIIILFMFFLYNNSTAQVADITVEGKVIDAGTGIPVPGANIIEKGTSNGVLSNLDGEFTITVPEDAILQVSLLGYGTVEVPVDGQQTIEVSLNTEASELDAVVVVGYGTQRKETLTGSVVEVEGEALEKNPSNNLTNSLAGRLPGVIGLNRSGEPGNNASQILIRGSSTLGSNTPLFVIDGVPGRGGYDHIDPRDIESISVLKDASAAIYGSRAANGVILITTKRGGNSKPIINYTFNQGITQPTRLPDFADAATLAEFQNEQLIQGGQTPRFGPEEIEFFRNGTDPINYPNTNWIESTLKDFSTQSRHSISARGGNEDVRYYLSGNFSNEEGIFKDGITNSKVLGIRSNTDVNLNENITVSLDLSFQEQNNLYPSSSFGNIIEQMYRNYSYLPDFYPNGLPGAGFVENLNPRLMVTDAHGYRDSKNNLYQTKASFDINIPQIPGLGIDGFVAYDKNQTKNKHFQKPAITYSYDSDTDEYVERRAGQIATPQLQERYDFNSRLILHGKIKYEKIFGDHRINTFVAIEQAANKSNYFSAFRRDFVSSEVDQLFAGGSANQETDGSASEFYRRNYFGRLSYGFMGRYLFDLNLRYDGSSAFPRENRWGFFPGISVGWIVSSEPFFEEALDIVNHLKLRGSWGKMGNDAIDPFQYLATYSLAPGYIFGEVNRVNPGLIMGVEPNPNITWEVAETTNIGLDARLFNNRISASIDVFKSTRSNILTQRNASIPDYTGLNLPLENIGIVENKGFELAISYDSQHTQNFNFNIGGNIAFAENIIIDIDEPENIEDWQRATGKPMNTDLYYEHIGIYRTQAEIDNSPHPPGTRIGDLQYRDINNDGIINSLDRVRSEKSSIPEITYGINMELDYKQFYLTMLLQGQGNAWGYYYIPQGLFGNVLTEMANNRPTPENPNSTYPNLTYDESQVSALQSDFWLKNTSFLRLKTLELGYNFSEDILSIIGLTGLRLYVNGFNLLTFDNLKIYDPEGDADRNAFYPQNKIYNLGINVTF